MKELFSEDSCRQQVAAFLGIEPQSLLASTHLFHELSMDSLGIFSLGMHLIKTFGIKIPLSEVSNIATYGDLYEAMERHRKELA